MSKILLANKPVRLAFTAVDHNCLRVTLFPHDHPNPFEELNGRYLSAAVKALAPTAIIETIEETQTIAVESFTITICADPLEILLHDAGGEIIQRLFFHSENGDVTFPIGHKAIFGLGQGFPTPMDRRGWVYDMKRHGQEPASVFHYATISAVPYLISLEGWGLFFHEPVRATIDLRGNTGKFSVFPADYRDIFVMTYGTPQAAAALYYKLTGRSPIPPKYAFGYQQSYRELYHEGASIVMPTARYMREHEIPCDMLIYLGRYINNGWNTYDHNGMFEFNPRTFPNPQAMIQELHDMHYRVALHITEAPTALHGNLDDVEVNSLEYDHVKNYWERHRQLYEYANHDAWWPDDGDELELASVQARHRMYHDGTEQITPNKRGFYMLRNAYCGDLQYGGVIWSGDVLCTWETLKNQIHIGLNVAMSLSPFWGSDIGGFHVTDEYSGELYVRWFEFSVFTPLFRSHGRHSFLHMPWGWKAERLADIPDEWARNLASNMSDAVLPDHRVEPICKKYIGLRYRLIPYIYTLARATYDIGTPLMRPLWFSFPDDERAAVCDSQYLFGSQMLVNPVTKKGTTEWTTYLPKGRWYDFFTHELLDGGRDVTRPVTLEDIPVFIPAGTIFPMGEVKQYIGDTPISPLDDLLTIYVYPGKDTSFTLYEDDGITKDYMNHQGTYTTFTWDDRKKRLTISGRSTQIPGNTRLFNVLYIGLSREETVACVYEKVSG